MQADEVGRVMEDIADNALTLSTSLSQFSLSYLLVLLN